MRVFISFFTFLIADFAFGQGQTLTLDQCYELARQNYPQIHQKELIVKSKEFTIGNAHSGYLPQFSINAQATYQSDVTKVPIESPSFSVPTLSKDQYRIYGEVNQTIYDGGTIKRNSALQESNAKTEDLRVEVELYKIKERINNIFFGVLLLDQQLVQVELLKKDLQTSLTKVEAAIRHGTAFRMNADILQAELLKADQRIIEIKALRKVYLDMLGIFINQPLDENTILGQPSVPVVEENDNISRPEINLFDSQRLLLSNQYQLTNSRNLPRLGLFFQGGYGRPGLNALKNEFAGYYIGGVRLSWNLSGFYNAKREKQLFEINNQLVDVQRDLFLFNTKLQLKQNVSEIAKLRELIKTDQQIISLRTRIKETAKVQLDNGVISTNDYLRELNAEDQAKQNEILHQVQLMMALVNYKTTSGN